MKKTRTILLFSILSFISGITLNSIRYNWQSHAQTPPEPASEAVNSNPGQTPCPDQVKSFQDKFPKLIEDKLIVEFNGRKLKLDYASWGMPEDIPYFINDAKVTPLKSGGLLVPVSNGLYRLNSRHEIVWIHWQGQMIFDHTFVEATNLVYGTAGDNCMFILDAATGKELYADSRNGSAAYGVAVSYGEDMCLVTDNFWFYRQRRFRDSQPMNDGITCWRGTEVLWRMDFPPDAELLVSGDKILAVTKTEKGIYVNEITPPSTAKE